MSYNEMFRLLRRKHAGNFKLESNLESLQESKTNGLNGLHCVPRDTSG